MNTNKFEPIQPYDKVIMSLEDDDVISLTTIQDQHEAASQLRRRLNRTLNKFYAMQIMFWDGLLSRSEQAETADNRGKSLSICRDEDSNLVVVERPSAKPDDPSAIFGFDKKDDDVDDLE